MYSPGLDIIQSECTTFETLQYVPFEDKELIWERVTGTENHAI